MSLSDHIKQIYQSMSDSVFEVNKTSSYFSAKQLQEKPVLLSMGLLFSSFQVNVLVLISHSLYLHVYIQVDREYFYLDPLSI